MTNVRMLKISGWENSFFEQANKVRTREMILHRNHNLTKNVSVVMWTTAPG